MRSPVGRIIKQSMANIEFEIKDFLSTKTNGAAFMFGQIDITSAQVSGRDFLFCTDTHRDIVQKTLRSGQLYEQEELQETRPHFLAGGVFVDIGANIGNHALFAVAFFWPSRIICFEPNPRAIRLLCANVTLNQMSDIVDLSYLGTGVSNETRGDFGMETRGQRLGSLKMLEGQGKIRVVAGDSVLLDVAPDFIKIDVEQMELKVLDGLEKTIRRHKPTIYVEVDKNNFSDFRAWLQRVDYEIIRTFPQNLQNDNFLIKSRKKL